MFVERYTYVLSDAIAFIFFSRLKAQSIRCVNGDQGNYSGHMLHRC